MPASKDAQSLSNHYLTGWLAALDAPIRTSALLTTASARIAQLMFESVGHAIEAQQPLADSIATPQRWLDHWPQVEHARQQRIRDNATVYFDILTRTNQELSAILGDLISGAGSELASAPKTGPGDFKERRQAGSVIPFPDRRVSLHVPPIFSAAAASSA